MPAFNSCFIYQGRHTLRGSEWTGTAKGLSSLVSLEELGGGRDLLMGSKSRYYFCCSRWTFVLEQHQWGSLSYPALHINQELWP